MKRILSLVLCLSLFPSTASAFYNPEIAGRNCKKISATRVVGNNSYICATASKNTRKWVLVGPVQTPQNPLGSYSNPVPLNMTVTYNNAMHITIHGSDFNVSEFVCLSNRFNDGCDSYSRMPASYSPDRWVRVDLTVKNISTGPIDVFWEYGWSAVLNGTHYGEYTSAASVDDLGDLEFLPGAEVTTSVYILVPKSAGTAGLIFAFRHSTSAWSYFRASL